VLVEGKRRISTAINRHSPDEPQLDGKSGPKLDFWQVPARTCGSRRIARAVAEGQVASLGRFSPNFPSSRQTSPMNFARTR